jgi:hypothetical protein
MIRYPARLTASSETTTHFEGDSRMAVARCGTPSTHAEEGGAMHPARLCPVNVAVIGSSAASFKELEIVPLEMEELARAKRWPLER